MQLSEGWVHSFFSWLAIGHEIQCWPKWSVLVGGELLGKFPSPEQEPWSPVSAWILLFLVWHLKLLQPSCYKPKNCHRGCQSRETERIQALHVTVCPNSCLHIFLIFMWDFSCGALYKLNKVEFLWTQTQGFKLLKGTFIHYINLIIYLLSFHFTLQFSVSM